MIQVQKWNNFRCYLTVNANPVDVVLYKLNKTSPFLGFHSKHANLKEDLSAMILEKSLAFSYLSLGLLPNEMV